MKVWPNLFHSFPLPTSALALLGAAGLSTAAQGQQCTVDWNDVHQRIDGFGGGVVFMNPASLDPVTDANMDTLFGTANTNQLGLTLIRVRIDPMTNWTAALSDGQKAIARGARVLATPWTPPPGMKNNNNIVEGSLLTSQYANYATYLNNFAGYMASNGAPLAAISIQNEPDANVNYESAIWTGTTIKNFCHSNAAAITFAPVMIPESESFVFNFSDPTLNDPVAAANVTFIGGHLYGVNTITDYPNAHNKGKPTWMTEFLVNDQTIGTAIDTAQQIHDCLTTGNMSAYIWWKCLGDANGLVDASGVPQKRGFVMSQFSRFVHPNYHRIGVSNSATTTISAYKDSVSPAFAIVAINTNTNATITQTFILTNFDAVSVTPWITSATSSLGVQPAVGLTNGAFTYTLPAQSVVTFVGQVPSISNVIVTARPNSAILSWTVSGGATSVLRYGTTPACTLTYQLSTPTAPNQSALIPGLITNSTYYFQIIAGSGNDGAVTNGTFSTDVEVVLQSSQATYAGVWINDSTAADKFSPTYKFASVAPAAPVASATFRPNIPVAGLYDVYLWYSEGGNRSTIAPVVVTSQNGVFSTTVNETQPGGQWQLITTQPFNAGTNAYVQLGNSTGENNKIVIADAVRWVYSPTQDFPANGNTPGWWTSFYFGNLVLSGSVPGANGYNLLQNYILGLSPVDPNAVLSINLHRSGTNVQAVFSPWDSGRQYQLQSALNLRNPLWLNVPNATLQITNGQGTFTDPNPGPAPKFYRLSVLMTP